MAIMRMKPLIVRSKQAVASFEKVIELKSKLTESEVVNAQAALDRANERLQKGRDDHPMPEGCVVC